MSEINGDNHAEKNTGGLNSVGAAVTEKTLNVIYFNMNDSGWADDVMQSCNEKIGDSGCALTAFAMIVNYLTGEGNPGTVNTSSAYMLVDLITLKLQEYTVLPSWPAR